MRSTARWLVPVAVAATIVGGTAVSSAMAGSTPTLPSRTPEQVLASVAGSRVTTLSGSVSTHADLGLPSLPSSLGGGRGQGSTSSPQALATRFLAGDNTVRVWVDGPGRQRAQLVDPWADLDVVRNGTDVWSYDSRSNTVQHATVPATSAGTSAGKSATTPGSSGTGVPDLRGATPDQLAQRVLSQVGPTTSVTLDAPAIVAGQDTYTLRITPRSTGTLVDHVQIAVDAANGMPLQVSVFARGHAAAVLRSGFTSVNFARPAGSVFAFTPPKGATVKQLTVPGAMMHPGSSGSPEKDLPGGRNSLRPKVIGTGWTSVVEIPAGATGTASLSDPTTAALLRQVTTPVAGGRALRTALLTVLLTDDGRVLAGSVPLQTLQDAAAHG